MASILFVAAALVASAFADLPISNAGTAAVACAQFFKDYSNLTHFNGNDTTYSEINTQYWTASAALGPKCIFESTTPEHVSYAVKTLSGLSVPFAVKGGGHMPVAGYANINESGVLLSSDGFKQLEICPDHTTVNVGSGNHWIDVYNYLDNYNKTVVGGRLGIVGVPGFMTGGGVSFFGSEYGWASANVASITAVLANGGIVKASATNAYHDLFWALRGGANSFAIVTNFELTTIPSPGVMVGSLTYATSNSTQADASAFLDGVYDYAVNGSADVKAATIPLVQYYSFTRKPSFTSFNFYNGGGPGQMPKALAAMSPPKMPVSANTFQYRKMGDWANEMYNETKLVFGLKNSFWVLNFYADREALQIVYDTYTEALDNLDAQGGFFISGMAVMPVPPSFFEASKKHGGDPQSVSSDGPAQVFVEESMTFGGGNLTDTVINQFYVDTNANITATLKARGKTLAKYLYLNDAHPLQEKDVWAGYPPENIARLKIIRDVYDPARVYTDLMPGGWKVDRA